MYKVYENRFKYIKNVKKCTEVCVFLSVYCVLRLAHDSKTIFYFGFAMVNLQ